MPIESLVELFGALATGMAALLSLAAVAWIVGARREPFARAISTSPMRPRREVGILILLLSAFGAGMLLESLADDLTDRSPDVSGWFSWLVWPTHGPGRPLNALRLPSEEATRFWTLYERARASDAAGWIIRPTPLLTELLSEVDFSRGPHAQSADLLWVPASGSAKDSKWLSEARRPAIWLYYQAHNWCYLQPTHMVELERLQRLLEFGRGVYLAMALGIPGVLLATLASLLLRWLPDRASTSDNPAMALGHPGVRVAKLASILLRWLLRRAGEPDYRVDLREGAFRAVMRRAFGWQPSRARAPFIGFGARLWRAAQAILVMLLVAWAGRAAYVTASESYNERAYGYYVSALRAARAGHPGAVP